MPCARMHTSAGSMPLQLERKAEPAQAGWGPGLRYWAADVGFLAIEPLGTCRFGSSRI